MYSVRSHILCLLSISALLLLCGDAGAVSLPPTTNTSHPSFPRTTTVENVSLWNLLNPWSGEIADPSQPLSCEGGSAGSGDSALPSSGEDDPSSDRNDRGDALRRSSRLLSSFALLVPNQSTGTGTSTSGASHAPGSSVALATNSDDLCPQIVIRLARQRESVHPILKPSSVFHPPRR